MFGQIEKKKFKPNPTDGNYFSTQVQHPKANDQTQSSAGPTNTNVRIDGAELSSSSQISAPDRLRFAFAIAPPGDKKII